MYEVLLVYLDRVLGEVLAGLALKPQDNLLRGLSLFNYNTGMSLSPKH